MVKRFYPLFVILFIALQSTSLATDSLSLPIYRITMDLDSLQYLYDNPWTDQYFPATFYMNDIEYSCSIRFRGTTARDLPKKSWRVKFENTDNIFDAKNINLNAEYRDKTLMRNHLAMELFRYYEYPAPDTKYINLCINDEYMGVFLQTEEIDKHFLAKHDYPENDIFKGINHGANMAPVLNYDSYMSTWEKKEGEPGDYTLLQTFLNQIYYWNNLDFQLNISNYIDIERVLTYFAIEFAISSNDCVTKNYFLYNNSSQGKWEIFPWDNDATFGNNWKGIYIKGYEKDYKNSGLEYNTLFQRLMNYKEWRRFFKEKTLDVLDNGFYYLEQFIDDEYQSIKNDVYQDRHKNCTNSEFDDEIIQLKTFLNNRSELTDSYFFEKTPLSNLYCSNYCPTTEDPNVVFRVLSDSPQNVWVNYIRNYRPNTLDITYDVKKIELYDDGNHNDLKAGDHIYGNEVSIEDTISGLVPFCFNTDPFTFPENGFFALELYKTNYMALVANVTFTENLKNIHILNIYKTFSSFFIELENKGNSDVDMSLYHIRAGEYVNDFIFPENTVLKSNEKLYISSDKELVNDLFGDFKSLGNLYFTIHIGDTLKLLSPIFTEISTKVCSKFSCLTTDKENIFINEINYHSCDIFNPKDWVELYNPSQKKIDLSGWIFIDNHENGGFVLPEETYLEPDSYLVLCEDKKDFSTLFPEVTKVIGDFDFGLNNAGELIRLYNQYGVLVDSVAYDDDPPWPGEPDGNGPTLELIRHDLDNACPESWGVSKNFGTPGELNSLDTEENDNPQVPGSITLFQNYPNPFNGITFIEFESAGQNEMTLEIINVQGQLVQKYKICPNATQIKWDATGYGSGIYFCRLKVDDDYYGLKKMLLLK
ncbi:CotH kinase family protein [candidate division KSB1 bacterium]|nr:CotH kinase family protein [candidate division KSB1 bacterium]